MQFPVSSGVFADLDSFRNGAQMPEKDGADSNGSVHFESAGADTGASVNQVSKRGNYCGLVCYLGGLVRAKDVGN